MISKLTSISVNLIINVNLFFVNLLHSSGVSFFTLDFFLTTWHPLTFWLHAYVVWGKVIISHLSVCSQGVLSLAGGTYPGWGYLPWPGRYLTWLGVLTFAWSTYPGKGATYLCEGYIPWLGRYLPWLGGTYPGLGRYLPFLAWISMLGNGVPTLMGVVLTLTGGTYLWLGEGIYLGQGDVPSLVIWENISLREGVMVLKEYFSLGGCVGPVKCQKNVKLLKRCQVVKKMSNVKKSNIWTMQEVHKK